MKKKFFENEDSIEDDILEGDFIKIQDNRKLNIKFYEVTENLETKDIIKDIKNKETMLLIDLKNLIEDSENLRLFVSKIKRISDTLPVTMKLYGSNWLIILPEEVGFYVGAE
jgi:SepF-like predicted cell division protein (DUF552 family)